MDINILCNNCGTILEDWFRAEKVQILFGGCVLHMECPACGLDGEVEVSVALGEHKPGKP